MVMSRLSFLILFSVCVAMLRAEDPSAAQIAAVRTAVKKAVPYLKDEGVDWMKKRGCVSCHQIPAMLWSLSAAHDRGFDVDAKELSKWQSWSVDVVNFVKPEQKKDVDRAEAMAGNIDTMVALMFAIPDGEVLSEWRGEFAKALIENQQDDGAWKACGQLPLQKRPKNETTQATSAWTYLALNRHDDDAKLSGKPLEFIDRGGIGNSQNAKSTEWWAVRGLLADQLSDSDRLASVRSRLLEFQNDDGGWGWIAGQESDALATGLAMYSLQRTTGQLPQDSMNRAAKFLIGTQKSNGSWSVPGTKTSAKGKSTPTSNYWGTAWAVIGLLETHAGARITTECRITTE